MCWWQLRTHVSSEPFIVLSESPADILSFLGLDGDTHREGFDSLADMFGWAAGSTFFDPRTFLDDDHSNAKDRQRLEKRAVYAAWLEYVRTFRVDKPQLRLGHEEVVEAFGARDAFDALHRREDRRKELKRILRPELLSKYVDGGCLSVCEDSAARGRRLGEAMQLVRRIVDSRYPTTIPTTSEVEDIMRSMRM